MECYIFLRLSFSPLSSIKKKTPTNQQENSLQPRGKNIMCNSASIGPHMRLVLSSITHCANLLKMKTKLKHKKTNTISKSGENQVMIASTVSS